MKCTETTKVVAFSNFRSPDFSLGQRSFLPTKWSFLGLTPFLAFLEVFLEFFLMIRKRSEKFDFRLFFTNSKEVPS